MTELANYQMIADFVKLQADKLDTVLSNPRRTGDGLRLEHAVTANVAEDLRAFGNGLANTIAAFRSALNVEDNVAKGIFHVELREAFTGDPIERYTMTSGAMGWAISFEVPAGHYVIEARYPNNYPPMIPEEV